MQAFNKTHSLPQDRVSLCYFLVLVLKVHIQWHAKVWEPLVESVKM